jgi:predicted dehydrogenase
MRHQKRIGIVGCGNIAKSYAESIRLQPNLELVGVTDLNSSLACEFANSHGCKAYSSVKELLEDDTVEIVVNLTIHHAHFAVIHECLEAGRHVYSEKPLAVEYKEARALVDLAAARGCRLACAPITFLGEAQQTAMKIVREGQLGAVRVIYAEVNWGRIESWHPNPAPFYAVGPVYDVAVYPVALLTALFGPACKVSAFGAVTRRYGTQSDGNSFEIATEDFSVAIVEFPSGPILRLTSSFYVTDKSKQPAAIEFHGDKASLHLSRWHPFDGNVEFAPYGEEYVQVPLVREPFEGVEWARGLADMADAIVEERPHRADGAHAAHVVEIMEAIHRSMVEGGSVTLHSTFRIPEPMVWAS